ncbi:MULTISPECIES: putative polysaccharide biosynthesis protein [Kitasatospora]|uniref:Putative polysaccharide biosynthesis protein n=1 Tax=Kitasatospora setae (strain ATCC 33774 / DSM 43861 / JCM 3304 / KCC A-0304 / NBRC 14216 / KM-6054) TaxID=452652 RepID=E4NCM6_KITSK|nr:MULTISPECIES: putative polysaccharide biosynthesis protein [Kitasatospora]BAJ28957.1 putative polysaccharide biosynthesis protein [Kitasatospora setae KM-6054]
MAADATHVVGNTYRALVPAGIRRRVSTQLSKDARTRIKRQLAVAAAPADRYRTERIHRRLQRTAAGADGVRRLPGGRLAQVHEELTPLEVLRHNLELTARTLDAAGVDWFAVPAVNDRHAALAVAARDRVRVYRALAAAFREAPGTVEQVLPAPRNAKPHYGADVRFGRLDGAKVIRVGWLRSDPSGGLVIGTSVAVEIEFWTRRGNRLTGPRHNRVMRTLPADAPLTTAPLGVFTQYAGGPDDGLRLRTRAEFTVRRADETDFDIDAVCLDAPGDDPELLRATLRSLHQYAPWLRRIHLLTTRQAPDWLADHPALRVHLAELPPGRQPEDVRAGLHLLPGLAEHFVLFPAGAMLGQRAKPHLFFTPFGYLRTFAADADGSESPDEPWRTVLEAEFGRTVAGTARPGPHARLRSLCATLADRLPPGAPRTRAERSGLAADPHDCLHQYWAYAEGRGLPGSARLVALRADAPFAAARLSRMLARRDAALLQFGGLADPETPADAAEAVRELLRTYFPVRSPYERADRSAAGADLPPGAERGRA